jgi:hypothetical protein
MCKHNAGICDVSVPDYRTDRKLLARAKKNLRENFVVIGLVEDLPTFACRMSRLLPVVPGAQLPVLNARPPPTPELLEHHTAEVQKLFEKSQLLDLALYEYAKRLLRRESPC